jgi:hypothetical protein
MIGRIWHGWAKLGNAGRHDFLLKEEVFPEIAAKRVSGCEKIRLLRRRIDSDEAGSIMIMRFRALDAGGCSGKMPDS